MPTLTVTRPTETTIHHGRGLPLNQGHLHSLGARGAKGDPCGKAVSAEAAVSTWAVPWAARVQNRGLHSGALTLLGKISMMNRHRQRRGCQLLLGRHRARRTRLSRIEVRRKSSAAAGCVVHRR